MAGGRLKAKDVPTSRPGRVCDGSGLWLITSPSLARRWAFRYSFEGRVTELGLGSFPTVSLDEAREAAIDARRLVKTGVNPVVARQQARLEARAVAATKAAIPTFGELADKFVEDRRESWKNEKHYRQWKMTLTKYAASIRDIPVNRVDRQAVLSVVEPLFKKAPTTASRLRNRIELVINSAQAMGYIDENKPNPARWRNGFDALFPRRPKGPRKHHKALGYEKIPGVISALRKKEKMANLALELCILCASRSGEVLNAKWSEIDLQARVWTIPAERMLKTGRPHRVPLCDRVVQILERVAELRMNDYVFPGRRKNRPMNALALDKAFKAITSEGTVHGTRSDFRDWTGNETDYAREIAEAALSHTLGDKAEQAYRRGDALERRRRLMEDWASFCGSACE